MEVDLTDIKALYHEKRKQTLALIAKERWQEWEALKDNLAERARLLELITTNRMLALGYGPKTFRYFGKCKQCGPVLLEFPCDVEVVGCPWCTSKKLGNA